MKDGHHRCPVGTCPWELPQDRLMCRKHWFWLSPKTRKQVWSTWRAYKASGDATDLREAYLKVRAMAIREANSKLPKPKPVQRTLFA